MADERRRIVFHGRVQGVGFRYRAAYYAASMKLTGWVRNESDDTVTMEVQGSSLLIDKLLKMMNSERYIEIEWMDSKNIPLADEKSFRVTY